jgi:beta-glucosidase
MGAYNRVYGEPACGSQLLLGDILRRRWGFQGHVVSDCGAVDDFHQHHRVTENAMQSAALAVRNGCDLNCGCTYNDLGLAVRDGLLTEKDIDTALGRLLTTKFKLGLFDPSARVPFSGLSTRVVESPAHRALARQAATESIVLLKNAGATLPLRTDPRTLLVTGPNASSVDALVGNYSGISAQLLTLLEGIAERVDENTILEYRPGCPLVHEPRPGLNYTFGVAAAAEVVIAVLGVNWTLEGEEGDAVASMSGGDRATIELPAVQRAFLRELRQHSKKLVLILTGGAALAIPEEHALCDAVLQVWYPGCEGGRAVADILFGHASPSGKLPVTVPHATTDLPAFNDYSLRGRTYRFATKEPLYPFGFGLSYATVRYSDLKLSTTQLTPNASLEIEATIANASDRTVLETVQCYVQPPASWPDAPRATLVDFRKVPLAAKFSTQVKFTLPAAAFRQFNVRGEAVWVSGPYGIVVGAASPGPRAIALGAPAPAQATVQLL